MILLNKKTLKINNTYAEIKDIKIDIHKDFGLKKVGIPDKKLHKFTNGYLPKFEQIFSLKFVNHVSIDNRDIELFLLELTDYWDNFFKQYEIDEISINNLDVCPYLFSLFIVSKFHKKKIIIVNKKENIYPKNLNLIDKNISIFKIILSNIISFFSTNNLNIKIYKYKYGKIENVNKSKRFLLMLKNIYFKIKLIKAIDKFKRRKFKMKEIFLLNKFDYLNLIYLNKEFINYNQYYELLNDISNNKFKHKIIDQQMIFNYDINEILNSTNSRFLILNKEITTIGKIIF